MTPFFQCFIVRVDLIHENQLAKENSMKNITRLSFLLCALLFPYMASAHPPMHSSETGFKIKEFAGDWILSSSSSGGVGINSGPGISSAVLRHVTFDKHGKGTENDVSRVFYLPDGSLAKFININVDSITLALTDPIHGAGSITITDSTAFHGTSVYNFIATRNKKGKINKLFLILVEGLGNSIVVSGVLERQQAE